MKILHTSDWHLGQFFIHRNRKEEHDYVLSEIIQITKSENIDILIVAGDIFDTSYPPNYALSQYYEFLRQVLRETTCRHIVITGGNHDSPSTLNAPKELLRFLDVRVIGCAERDRNQEINSQSELVELQNQDGEIEAVIFAVPYLRDRDLKFSVAGETVSERAEALKTAIQRHYADGARLVDKYISKNIPILTTGHLFAAGLTDEDGEKMEFQDAENDIHIGNLGKIEADTFPEIFSYVALGHIHKPQKVGGKNHIRYSGSPIPLSFSERTDKKSVVILEYEGAKLINSELKFLTKKRQLIRFSGTFEKIQEAITRTNIPENELEAWAEVRLKAEQIEPDADEKLKKLGLEYRIEILKVVINRQDTEDDFMENMDLEDVDIKEVFLEKCKSDGITNTEQLEVLSGTFDELRTLVNEKDVL